MSVEEEEGETDVWEDAREFLEEAWLAGQPGGVSSLVCFHCENAESNWGCVSTKTCGENDKYCITKYFGGGLGENHKQSITKDCSAHCPKGGLDLGVMAFSINCCETSLCNTSGAISVKSSSLLLAVGTLASLLYIFGAKL